MNLNLDNSTNACWIAHGFINLDNYTKNIFILSNIVAINTLVLKHLVFPILSFCRSMSDKNCINISDNYYVRYIQAKDSYRSLLLVLPFANFFVYLFEIKENAELKGAKLLEKLDPCQLLHLKNLLKKLSTNAKENFIPLAHKFNFLEESECETIRSMYSKIEDYTHSYPTIPDNEIQNFDELFHFIKNDKHNPAIKGIIYILLPSMMHSMNPQHRLEHLRVFTNLAKNLPQNKLNLLSHIFTGNAFCNFKAGYLFKEMHAEELQFFMQTLIDQMKPQTPEKVLNSIFKYNFDLVTRALEKVSPNEKKAVMNTVLRCSLYLHPKTYPDLLLRLIKKLSVENYEWMEKGVELVGDLMDDYSLLDSDSLESLITCFLNTPLNQKQNFYQYIQKCKSLSLSLLTLSRMGKMLGTIPTEEQEKFIDDLLSIKNSYSVCINSIIYHLHDLKDPLKAIKKVLEFPEINKHGNQDRLIECIVMLSPLESTEFIFKFITDKKFGPDNVYDSEMFFKDDYNSLEKKQEIFNLALVATNAGMFTAKLDLEKLNKFYLGHPMFFYILVKITEKYELFDLCWDSEKQKIIEIAEFYNDTTIIGKLKKDDPLSTPFFKEFPSLLPDKNQVLVKKMVDIPNEVYRIFSSQNDFYSLSQVNKAFQEKFLIDYPKKLITEIQDLQKQLALSEKLSPEIKEDINFTCLDVITTLQTTDLQNLDLEKLKEFVNSQKIRVLTILSKHRVAEVISVTGMFSIIRYTRQREQNTTKEVLEHQLTNENFHYSILTKSKNYDFIKIASDELKQKVKAIAATNHDQEVLENLSKHKVI